MTAERSSEVYSRQRSGTGSIALESFARTQDDDVIERDSTSLNVVMSPLLPPSLLPPYKGGVAEGSAESFLTEYVQVAYTDVQDGIQTEFEELLIKVLNYNT